MDGPKDGSGNLRDGERVLLVDARGRHYLVDLRAGGTWHSHGGAVRLDELIGRPEGSRVRSGTDMGFVAFRPRMADLVFKMPRGAQVIYPKDIASILAWGDIGPGRRVLEAGTGSGALTMSLAAAVGSAGRVLSFELRPEFRATAERNVERALGGIPPWVELRDGDLRDVVPADGAFDRCVLDLPDPWTVLQPLRGVLEPGGVLTSYVPTVPQVQQLVTALGDHGFLHVESFETLHRSWHVTARSVRPDHRMVAHTGFITVARRLADADGRADGGTPTGPS